MYYQEKEALVECVGAECYAHAIKCEKGVFS